MESTNPIMNFVQKITIDDTSIELTMDNIIKNFKKVYVLVKKDDFDIPISFYSKFATSDVINEVSKHLIIWETSINILNNKNHYNKLVVLSNEQLEVFNEFKFELKEKNLVIPILTVKFKNLISYLQHYDGISDFTKFYNMLLLFQYFDTKNYEHMLNLIKNIDESNYWTLPYNCLLSIDESFQNRKFHIDFYKKLKDVPKDEKNFTTKNNDYLKDIYKSSKQAFKPMDTASKMKKKGYKLYKISPGSEFTKDDINKVFDILNDEQRYYLFCNLCVSKELCHLVINNENILTLMKPVIEKNALLFRYLFGYAWLRFYAEESIKNTFTTRKDEYIFDINTASKLPVFPFTHKYAKFNPYMPILVSDEHLKPDNNIFGLEPTECNEGICNLDEFKQRLNIFTTDNSTRDLFSDIDWDKNKVALGGSVMAACLQKNHPLISMFSHYKTFDEQYSRYFNEYYAKADIDLMFNTEDTFEYLKNVQEIYNQLVVNIMIIHSPYAEPEHIRLNPLFQAHVFVNYEWVKKNLVNDNITIEFIKENINELDVINLFRPYFEIEMSKKISETTKGMSNEEISIFKSKYPDYFIKFSEYIIKIHMFETKTKEKINNSDLIDSEIEENIIETVSSNSEYFDIKINYKYRINSPHLNHPIELFMVKYSDHMSVVSKFHLPCVRAFYTGNNVYMTPSCISAHMTYMNIDYKYFAGSSDPIDIINKYRMRGFGTWLNQNEIENMTKYCTSVPQLQNYYGTNNKIPITGAFKLPHKLFHPRLISAEDYYDAPPVNLEDGYSDNNLTYKTYPSVSVFLEFYYKKYPSIKYIMETSMLEVIDSDGNIKPLQKWIIDAYYHLNK